MSNICWSRITRSTAALGVALALITGCATKPSLVVGELERYPQDSPLVHALGLDGSLEQMQSYRVLAREKSTECMRSRGFDLPMLAVEQLRVDPILEQWHVLDEEVFAAEYGFGVLVSGSASIAERSEDTAMMDYIETLGESEVEAFTDSYFGAPTAGAFESSCVYFGEQAATDAQSNQRWDLYDRFAREISNRIDADPRVVGLHQSFETCMAELGYDYPTPYDVRDAASDRFTDFITSVFLGASDVGLRAGLDTAGQARFDALEQQEIDEAMASLSCERPIRSTIIELSAEIEGDWLARNGDLITAALAN